MSDDPKKLEARVEALEKLVKKMSVAPPTKTKTLEPLFPENLQTEEFKEAWALWIKHRIEIKKPLKPTTVAMQLKRLSREGPIAAIKRIVYTLEGGWQGLSTDEMMAGQAKGTGTKTASDDARIELEFRRALGEKI